MAFDGIVIANLVKEFSDALTGGKIAKITLAYLTDTNKQGPMTAPNFCMLLRKHIGSGRIVSVSQPGLERCIHFEIEHLDEMGDLCRKLLIVELMGKYSNIIFCSPDGTILDSIKHISVQVSSVREVLPGRQYFLPQTVAKQDPLPMISPPFWHSHRHRQEKPFTRISPVSARSWQKNSAMRHRSMPTAPHRN